MHITFTLHVHGKPHSLLLSTSSMHRLIVPGTAGRWILLWRERIATFHWPVRVSLLCYPPEGDRLLTTLSIPCRLTTVIISRFLLELQQANQIAVRVDLDDPSQSCRNPWDSTPSFISSLGGFINSDHPALSEDDDAFESQVGTLSEAGEEGDDKREFTQSHHPPSLEARDLSPSN